MTVKANRRLAAGGGDALRGAGLSEDTLAPPGTQVKQ